MNRLIGGIAAALLVVACSAGTGGTTTTIPLDTGAVGSAAGEAKAQLCDPTNPASLKSLATALATVDPNADTTTLQTNLGTAADNLQQVAVTDAQSTLRDAAVTGIGQVQSALANPQTLTEISTQAITALETLEASLCM